MGFEVKFDALDTLYGGVYSRGGAWSSALSEVSDRVGTLISSDNMSGEGADSAKLYLDSVHNTIIPMLADLIRLHVNNCLLYVTDYQSNIDTSLHAVINESELTDIKDSLKQDAENASDIDDEVQAALKSVSDIVSVSCAGMSTVSSKNTSIRNKITALIDDVTALEDSHSQKDFTETGELISALTAFIKERLGDTRAFKTSFSVDTIANSASFQAMQQAYVAVSERNKQNQEAVLAATEKERTRLEALQEEYQQPLDLNGLSEEQQEVLLSMYIENSNLSDEEKESLFNSWDNADTAAKSGLITALSQLTKNGLEAAIQDGAAEKITDLLVTFVQRITPVPVRQAITEYGIVDIVDSSFVRSMMGTAAKAAPFIGCALDIGTQIAAGEDVGDAIIKGGAHTLIGAGITVAATAIFAATPVGWATVFAFVATVFATTVFDNLYDRYADDVKQAVGKIFDNVGDAISDAFSGLCALFT